MFLVIGGARELSVTNWTSRIRVKEMEHQIGGTLKSAAAPNVQKVTIEKLFLAGRKPGDVAEQSRMIFV